MKKIIFDEYLANIVDDTVIKCDETIEAGTAAKSYHEAKSYYRNKNHSNKF